VPFSLSFPLNIKCRRNLASINQSRRLLASDQHFIVTIVYLSTTTCNITCSLQWAPGTNDQQPTRPMLIVYYIRRFNLHCNKWTCQKAATQTLFTKWLLVLFSFILFIVIIYFAIYDRSDVSSTLRRHVVNQCHVTCYPCSCILVSMLAPRPRDVVDSEMATYQLRATRVWRGLYNSSRRSSDELALRPRM